MGMNYVAMGTSHQCKESCPIIPGRNLLIICVVAIEQDPAHKGEPFLLIAGWVEEEFISCKVFF